MLSRRKLLSGITGASLITVSGCVGSEQPQAQQTGEETSDRRFLKSDKVVGYSTDGGKIETVNVSIRLLSGADPTNVSKTAYVIETGSSSTAVNGNPDVTTGLTLYPVNTYKKSSTILTEQSDVIIAEFDFNELQGISPFEPNSNVTFVLSPSEAESTRISFETPAKIKEDEEYVLLNSNL